MSVLVVMLLGVPYEVTLISSYENTMFTMQRLMRVALSYDLAGEVQHSSDIHWISIAIQSRTMIMTECQERCWGRMSHR